MAIETQTIYVPTEGYIDSIADTIFRLKNIREWFYFYVDNRFGELALRALDEALLEANKLKKDLASKGNTMI